MLPAQSKKMQLLIKAYLFLNIGFWPIALMYKEEYNIVPLKIEEYIYSLLLGSLFNTGLFVSLTPLVLKWRKIILCFFPFALLSSFVFYLPGANPSSSLSNEAWLRLRTGLSFLSVCFVTFTAKQVWVSKNEN